MKTFFAVVVCGLLACATALPRVQRKIHPDRIVGGEDATQGEIKYQISLRYSGSHICGGSIAMVNNKQVIITAAHCVDSGSARQFTVVAGDLDRNDNSGREQTRQVSRIIAHEDYDGWTFANDIAVLLIASPFDVNADVAPIALPTFQQQTSGRIVVSGWGTTQSGGSLPNRLQKVEIPVVPDDVCQQAYTQETILSSMLCAGLLGEGGKDSCQGDSGGPLRAVNGDYLAGVVSWGYGCADARYPGVNTEVSYFVDWLEANVE